MDYFELFLKFRFVQVLIVLPMQSMLFELLKRFRLLKLVKRVVQLRLSVNFIIVVYLKLLASN